MPPPETWSTLLVMPAQPAPGECRRQHKYVSKSTSLRGTTLLSDKRVHPSHHKVGERSIFEELEFDIVFGFPQEAMHEIYGGCVQRLLQKWFVKGHLLPSRQRTMICENVKRMTRSITEDFARKNIDLNKVNQWKCSEFRCTDR